MLETTNQLTELINSVEEYLKSIPLEKDIQEIILEKIQEIKDVSNQYEKKVMFQDINGVILKIGDIIVYPIISNGQAVLKVGKIKSIGNNLSSLKGPSLHVVEPSNETHTKGYLDTRTPVLLYKE